MIDFIRIFALIMLVTRWHADLFVLLGWDGIDDRTSSTYGWLCRMRPGGWMQEPRDA